MDKILPHTLTESLVKTIVKLCLYQQGFTLNIVVLKILSRELDGSQPWKQNIISTWRMYFSFVKALGWTLYIVTHFVDSETQSKLILTKITLVKLTVYMIYWGTEFAIAFTKQCKVIRTPWEKIHALLLTAFLYQVGNNISPFRHQFIQNSHGGFCYSIF